MIGTTTTLPRRPSPAPFRRLALGAVYVFASISTVGPLVAQGGEAAAGIPLYDGGVLGSYSWKISTQSAEAQAYFDQGVRLMYSYAPVDARRSFEEARRRDPSCAMCWWGEAWAMGPYFNGPMSPDDLIAADEAIGQAVRLAGSVPAVEAALIRAMDERYSASVPVDARRGLDSTYVREMENVHSRFPAHDDVATLYADALMLLEPRRGAWPMTKPAVLRIHEVLEEVLARNLGHPGACHAYVHATETTPKVTLAQPCADLLGASIPGASHINHMPSHTYNRVGRWGDATAANIIAWQSDLKAARGEGFAIYPAHNLHMLLFSASMDGQGAIAIQAAKDYAKLTPADGSGFLALVLTRFGRFDEVLELRTPPTTPIHRGLWAFGRGLSHLRLGAADSARVYLAAVDSIAVNTPATQVFRVHTPLALLGIVGDVLRGEIFRQEGRLDEAVAAFEEGRRKQSSLTYDEPEPLPFMVDDFLGSALLEAGRPAEALTVFQAALQSRPANGWSLKGVQLSLEALDCSSDAAAARQAFEAAWVRSEVWLPAPRY